MDSNLIKWYQILKSDEESTDRDLKEDILTQLVSGDILLYDRPAYNVSIEFQNSHIGNSHQNNNLVLRFNSRFNGSIVGIEITSPTRSTNTSNEIEEQHLVKVKCNTNIPDIEIRINEALQLPTEKLESPMNMIHDFISPFLLLKS